MQVGMLEAKDISWQELDRYTKTIESITLDEIRGSREIYFSNNASLVTILSPEK